MQCMHFDLTWQHSPMFPISSVLYDHLLSDFIFSPVSGGIKVWKPLLELSSSQWRRWATWWFWQCSHLQSSPSSACSCSWGTCGTSAFAGPFLATTPFPTSSTLRWSTTPQWPTTQPSMKAAPLISRPILTTQVLLSKRSACHLDQKKNI